MSDTSTGATARTEPILKHPWRFAIVAAVLLVVVNLGYFVLSESDTTQKGDTLPIAVESITPERGEILQDEITADLQNTYTGVLIIDRQEVPEDQLTRVVDLGEVTFRPGPDKDVEKFQPGLHTVVVLYWVKGQPRPAHPDAFSWTFRAVA
jgi:hypothetical protein